LKIHAIWAQERDRVRRTGLDASGNPPEHVTAEGGEPLRCCLRNARAGESLILFGYEPPIGNSPYREVGAVFAHAERCAGPPATDAYPAAWRGEPPGLRSLRRRGGGRGGTGARRHA